MLGPYNIEACIVIWKVECAPLTQLHPITQIDKLRKFGPHEDILLRKVNAHNLALIMFG